MMEVAAGIVLDRAGRVLLCQRKGELDGLWEFPGGKREDGESFAECLKRELWEELRLEVTVRRELCRMPYVGEGKTILLSFLLASVREEQRLVLAVHQDAQWVKVKDIETFALCPADAAFVRGGGLEEECLLT